MGVGYPSGTGSMHSMEEGTPHSQSTPHPTPEDRPGGTEPVGTKAATEKQPSGGLAAVQSVSLQEFKMGVVWGGGSELGENHRTQGPP